MGSQNGDATLTGINDLIQALNSRVVAYGKAADLVDNSQAKNLFQEYAAQSEEWASELFRFAGTATLSDDSFLIQVLSGWEELASVTNPNDTKALYAWCEREDDEVLKSFDRVCKSGLALEIQPIVSRQYISLKEAHGHIKALRDA